MLTTHPVIDKALEGRKFGQDRDTILGDFPWETFQENLPIQTPNIYPKPAMEGRGWGYRKEHGLGVGGPP